MRTTEWHFWTIDKFKEEEKWLNEKAARGKALVYASGIKYIFEDCEKGEYLYKIMFTDNLKNEQPRKDFETFLQESGIETVGNYLRWGYYRKKNDGTPFEMFNSKSEELTHINKIKNFAMVLLAVISIVVLSEFMSVLAEPSLLPVLIFNCCVFAFVFKINKGIIKLAKETEAEIALFE